MSVIKEKRQLLTSRGEAGDPIKYWNESARKFITHIEGKSGGDGRMIRDEILHPKMLDHLGIVGNKKILDLGGGEGILSRQLKEKGASVTTSDRIFTLLESAKSIDSQIPSVELNAVEKLPFANETFDRVVSNLVLMWLPKIDTVARETFRILKPGGIFVFSITHPMVNLGEFDLSDETRPQLKLQASLQDGTWLKMINETNGPYPYFQRTPARYVNAFTHEGFNLTPGQGYEDVYFPKEFVEENPQYLKHQWYPLFLILAFEKPVSGKP